MTPEQKAAHQRMLSTLPVRTHLVDPDGAQYRNRLYGKSGLLKFKPMVFDGQRDVAERLRVGERVVNDWIERGILISA